jgi:LysR family transcriptional regulator, transcriptional activator for dmlA
MGRKRALKCRTSVSVLAQYETPDADIYAVYPQRHQHTVRVAAFVKFLSKSDRDILEV